MDSQPPPFPVPARTIKIPNLLAHARFNVFPYSADRHYGKTMMVTGEPRAGVGQHPQLLKSVPLKSSGSNGGKRDEKKRKKEEGQHCGVFPIK